MSDPATPRKIIGFVCERSLPLDRMLDANKALLDDPDTLIIPVPCSGFVKPTQMELALANGAAATFVCGCAIGDCHFRTGNLMIRERLDVLEAVGLGYVKLGQSSTTLSGGEAQRIKIAAELIKKATGKTLYLLDEPTTGLHFNDIRHLLHALYDLRAQGNTVIVIEHNLDVIKTADYVIDLGPEGGKDGGQIVACGSPEDVAREPRSHTGRFLKKLLKIDQN